MGGGIVFALDAKTQGVVILARATDAAARSKLMETLANSPRVSMPKIREIPIP